MKILNLYAGIGGNRKLWGDEHDITAVEYDEAIAAQYKKFFPKDNVIVADAHKYLLEHYEEFDFIWSSPPCPSHSKVRRSNPLQNKPIFPDMKLYEEILFLKHNFKGKWVVENVIPYYEPLIKPQISGRHCFWSNFTITKMKAHNENHSSSNAELIGKSKGIDTNFDIKDKVKVIRNCVNPKVGLEIFECAFKTKQIDLNKYGENNENV